MKANVRHWTGAGASLLLVLVGVGLVAQANRNPLSGDESAQIQDSAGHLDKRVDLLLQFAQARLTRADEVRTATPRPPDRADAIYSQLEQYAAILPELDNNLDALVAGKVTSETGSAKVKPTATLNHVVEEETHMLSALHEFQTASAAADLATYRFVLDDCLDVTNESLHNAQQDLAGLPSS